MVVSHTARVRPTLDVTAGINAPVGSLHRLTDLIIATVQIILARGGLAARLQIFSIPLEAGLAETLPGRAHGIWAALHSLAQVVFSLGHRRLLGEALIERVAPHAGLAATVVAAHRVDADRVLAAQAAGALIHISAAKERNSGKASQAVARLAAIAIRPTFGIVPAAAGVLAIAVVLLV